MLQVARVDDCAQPAVYMQRETRPRGFVEGKIGHVTVYFEDDGLAVNIAWTLYYSTYRPPMEVLAELRDLIQNRQRKLLHVDEATSALSHFLHRAMRSAERAVAAAAAGSSTDVMRLHPTSQETRSLLNLLNDEPECIRARAAGAKAKRAAANITAAEPSTTEEAWSGYTSGYDDESGTDELFSSLQAPNVPERDVLDDARRIATFEDRLRTIFDGLLKTEISPEWLELVAEIGKARIVREISEATRVPAKILLGTQDGPTFERLLALGNVVTSQPGVYLRLTRMKPRVDSRLTKMKGLPLQLQRVPILKRNRRTQLVYVGSALALKRRMAQHMDDGGSRRLAEQVGIKNLEMGTFVVLLTMPLATPLSSLGAGEQQRVQAIVKIAEAIFAVWLRALYRKRSLRPFNALCPFNKSRVVDYGPWCSHLPIQKPIYRSIHVTPDEEDGSSLMSAMADDFNEEAAAADGPSLVDPLADEATELDGDDAPSLTNGDAHEDSDKDALADDAVELAEEDTTPPPAAAADETSARLL